MDRQPYADRIAATLPANVRAIVDAEAPCACAEDYTSRGRHASGCQWEAAVLVGSRIVDELLGPA